MILIFFSFSCLWKLLGEALLLLQPLPKEVALLRVPTMLVEQKSDSQEDAMVELNKLEALKMASRALTVNRSNFMELPLAGVPHCTYGGLRMLPEEHSGSPASMESYSPSSRVKGLPNSGFRMLGSQYVVLAHHRSVRTTRG